MWPLDTPGTSISAYNLILHVTLSRFCLYLLIFINLITQFSHANIEAHTHKHTCIIRTHEEWRQPGTGAWLGGGEEGFLVRDKGHTNIHTHKHYFCISNKINDSTLTSRIFNKKRLEHTNTLYYSM